MEELLSELTGSGAPVALLLAVGAGMLLAQVLGLIAWSILGTSRSGRSTRRAKSAACRPTA